MMSLWSIFFHRFHSHQSLDPEKELRTYYNHQLNSIVGLVTLIPYKIIGAITTKHVFQWYLYLTVVYFFFGLGIDLMDAWDCVARPAFDHTDNCTCNGDCGVGLLPSEQDFDPALWGIFLFGLFLLLVAVGIVFVLYIKGRHIVKEEFIERRIAEHSVIHGIEKKIKHEIDELEHKTKRMVRDMMDTLWSEIMPENIVLAYSSWGLTGRTPFILRVIVTNIIGIGAFVVNTYINNLTECGQHTVAGTNNLEKGICDTVKWTNIGLHFVMYACIVLRVLYMGDSIAHLLYLQEKLREKKHAI